MFEKVLSDKLMSLINKTLYEHQHVLSLFSNFIDKNNSNPFHTLVIFSDFKKAFEQVQDYLIL